MKVVYATQTPPDSWTSSIFLAGPTPREDGSSPPVPSWRPQALEMLEQLGYDGVVFVPETEDGIFKHDYDDQIEWEEMCLNYADKILFWIPRDLATLPGFTTNDEWGFWKKCDPAKLILGTPPGASKTKYQRYYADKLLIPTSDSLAECCLRSFCLAPTLRTGGERCVPLHIWETSHFQTWYQNLITAGNELRYARVEWSLKISAKLPPFFFILHVDVYVKDEDRVKSNEVIISRPDTSMVLLYKRGATLLETKIVMIEEFRSPVSNIGGRVLTLPGGSSLVVEMTPDEIASEECHEEVGIYIPANRFITHSKRQLDASALTHQAHLFSYQLSDAQLEEIEWNAKEPLGVTQMQEITIRRVMTFKEVLTHPHVDWAVLGMITSVLS